MDFNAINIPVTLHLNFTSHDTNISFEREINQLIQTQLQFPEREHGIQNKYLWLELNKNVFMELFDFEMHCMLLLFKQLHKFHVNYPEMILYDYKLSFLN